MYVRSSVTTKNVDTMEMIATPALSVWKYAQTAPSCSLGTKSVILSACQKNATACSERQKLQIATQRECAVQDASGYK